MHVVRCVRGLKTKTKTKTKQKQNRTEQKTKTKKAKNKQTLSGNQHVVEKSYIYNNIIFF